MRDDNIHIHTPHEETIVGVEVDGTMWTTGLIRDLVKEKAELSAFAEKMRENNNRNVSALIDFRKAVRGAFTEMVDDGTMDRETANEVLEGLDLDRLPAKYTATLTITAEVTFESALDLMEVESALEAIDVNLDSYGGGIGDFAMDNASVTVEQVDEE